MVGQFSTPIILTASLFLLTNSSFKRDYSQPFARQKYVHIHRYPVYNILYSYINFSFVASCDCWRSQSGSPSTSWSYTGHVDAIDFQTDGSVNLQGYRLWGVSSVSSTTFQVTISLYQGNSLVAETTGSYFTRSSDQTFEVHFSQQIPLSAGVLYTATAKITTSATSFYLSDGMNSAFRGNSYLHILVKRWQRL